MARSGRRGKKNICKLSATKKGKKVRRPTPEEWTRARVFVRGTVYVRSPEQFDCYICGAPRHLEHFCPYNYIYGRCDYTTCTGGACPPGQHSITPLAARKLLRRFVRVSNLPVDFRELELRELCSPFGPLLMSDVPRLRNGSCYCWSEIPMSFGVVVFKKHADAARASDGLNGYDAGGSKIRVDWVYPSSV